MDKETDKSQEAIQISEIRYRRLFETAKDGILILDADTGKIDDVNPFLVELLGYSYDQFISKTIWDIGFFKDIIANRDNFEELKAKKYLRYEDLPLETADGRKIEVEFVSNVYQVNKYSVIQCNIRDITDRKKIENALARHAAELTAANESLKAFAHSIAHDLRNPLHSIIGCSEIVKDAIPVEDKSAHEALGYIISSSHKMAKILTDLMSLSKIARHETQFTRCSLSEIAKSITDEFKRMDKKRKVAIIIAPGLLADADAGLIRILLQNLLQNAWKFTSNTEDARIEFGKQGNEHSTSRYFVRDNGAGFDMVQAERLFQPFQRLHSQEEYSGTGIGLTIVKRIIEKHGGTITVEAEKDKGATFYFTLA